MKVAKIARLQTKSTSKLHYLKIAILGPTNAGKSSLLNYFSKREVAIVSEIAGTTRDIVEVHLNIDGYPVVMSDTAGIRNSKDEKKTIIFSSHRMEEVQSLADDIGVIYNGKLIFSGSKVEFESLSDSNSYDDTLISLIDNS